MAFPRLVSALVLGALQDEENYEFKMPLVEQLTLRPSCKIKHFQAALGAGMSTVKRLTVEFFRYEGCAATEKLEALTRMIRGAVKLNSLTLRTYAGNGLNHLPLRQSIHLPLRQLFQALEACATVTEIHVNNYDGSPNIFTEPEVQELLRITARNRFVANPSTFPNDKLLNLMIQLSDCPSGLYMLTRRLPEVFSFEKGDSLFPLMEPNTTRMSFSALIASPSSCVFYVTVTVAVLLLAFILPRLLPLRLLLDFDF